MDLLSSALLGAGSFFFVAGTIGLYRLPDVYSRIHAMTKVDNIGFGMISAGVILQSDSVIVGVKITMIWIFVMAASAACSFLMIRHARRLGIPTQEKS
jgi:multicomponent Na+:H+ antiporter subunit G